MEYNVHMVQTDTKFSATGLIRQLHLKLETWRPKAEAQELYFRVLDQ